MKIINLNKSLILQKQRFFLLAEAVENTMDTVEHMNQDMKKSDIGALYLSKMQLCKTVEDLSIEIEQLSIKNKSLLEDLKTRSFYNKYLEVLDELNQLKQDQETLVDYCIQQSVTFRLNSKQRAEASCKQSLFEEASISSRIRSVTQNYTDINHPYGDSRSFIDQRNNSHFQDKKVTEYTNEAENSSSLQNAVTIPASSEKTLAENVCVLGENLQNLTSNVSNIKPKLPESKESANVKVQPDNKKFKFIEGSDNAFRGGKVRDKSVGVETDKSKYINKIVCKESRNDNYVLLKNKGLSFGKNCRFIVNIL